MKKIKKLFVAIALCFIMVFIASCNKKSSGIKASDIDMEITTTRDKATVKLTLADNDNVKKEKATFYINCYTVNSDSEDYRTKQDVSFVNSVYTSATVNFTSLAANQEYKFVLYVTFNGKDSKLLEKNASTSDEVSTTISSKEDFENNLTNDLDGEFKLTSDIDFGNEKIGLFTSEAKAFQGKLDGGIYDEAGKLIGCHKISNFQLTSNAFIGLFGYLKGATIKNLIIENVKADYSTRSSASIGGFIGYAVGSYIENVEVNNVSLSIAASSTAEHNTGAVVGLSERSTFKNVYAKDVEINYTSAKIKMNIGGFAGEMIGDALTEGITAKSCGVEGNIKLVSDYTSSGTNKEFINIGGFVGSLSAKGVIDDCYAKAEAIYGVNNQKRTFDLSIGGFVGTNKSNMYIKNSLAIAVINAYAGLLPEDDTTPDYSTEYLASGVAYIGGFIGKANGVFRGIEGSYCKESGMSYITANDLRKETVDDVETDKEVLYAGSFYGYVDSKSEPYIIDSDYITTEVPENLSERLKELLQVK